VSRFFSSSLWLLVPGAALGGRLLNGGLIFLPLQKLLFAYALRTQLVNLAVDHLLPGMIGLLLISRAGMGIAIRTTLSRARGTWPSLNTPDDAALIRAADLLVLPRALAVGLAGLLLACFGLMALMAGFAFQWDAVRFSTTVDTFLFGFKDFTSLTGIPALLWCLLKSAFIGTAVGFVSCYEGLRGPPHETDVYQVIARTFGSSAAAWLITDIWMTLLWSGLERFVSGGIA
jgi:ABC-type transporter Mla maintaining outer membrane lipid asymmetry permease subunit MlaE